MGAVDALDQDLANGVSELAQQVMIEVNESFEIVRAEANSDTMEHIMDELDYVKSVVVRLDMAFRAEEGRRNLNDSMFAACQQAAIIEPESELGILLDEGAEVMTGADTSKGILVSLFVYFRDATKRVREALSLAQFQFHQKCIEADAMGNPVYITSLKKQYYLEILKQFKLICSITFKLIN